MFYLSIASVLVDAAASVVLIMILIQLYKLVAAFRGPRG
jgi:hypothetical protein